MLASGIPWQAPIEIQKWHTIKSIFLDGPAFEVATQRIRQALNVDLKRAVVISEDEHDNDYFLDEDEVVFVLPDAGRLSPAPDSAHPSANLVATAKLLMACTPNRISRGCELV
jgi:hypothetical protein